MQKKPLNRWFVVFGAVLLQVCLGAIYSWSLFNQPLMDKFGWSKDQVILTYSIAIFVFAFSTIFSGRLMDKIGPRKVATIGGVLYGAGMILSSFATTLPMLYFGYGVLAGAGVGFAYVCPLSACVKWFPEKRGAITGIAVGAFGAGSLIFKSIIVNFIDTVGVSQTFFNLGVIYLVLVVIGAQFLRLPEASKTAGKSAAKDEENTFTTGEMVKTKAFAILVVMYMFGCMPGLLVIGLAKDIGVEMVKLTPAVAANGVAIIALFNAGGRLAWGAISDKLGKKQVVLYMFIMTAASLVALSTLSLNFPLFVLCLAGIAFSYGGFLAVFPTITGEYFGLKNLGANYGVMYQAYGIAALVGPIIKKSAGSLTMTFMIAAGFAVIGAALTFLVSKPTKATSVSKETAVA